MVSVIAPFGIGHAIQGRWLESGWIFTAGELAIIGAFATTMIFDLLPPLKKVVLPPGAKSKPGDFHADGPDGPTYYRRVFTTAHYLVFGTFFLAVLGLRIWEIVSAWNPPSHYRIVKAPKCQVSPMYIARYKDTSTAGLGFSFTYRF